MLNFKSTSAHGYNFSRHEGVTIIKEALKIAYVAMSTRYLLCVAVDKKHLIQEDYNIILKLWNVVEV